MSTSTVDFTAMFAALGEDAPTEDQRQTEDATLAEGIGYRDGCRDGLQFALSELRSIRERTHGDARLTAAGMTALTEHLQALLGDRV